MIIDGVFKSQSDQITEYQELLKTRILIDQHGGEYILLIFEDGLKSFMIL